MFAHVNGENPADDCKTSTFFPSIVSESGLAYRSKSTSETEEK